MYNSDQVVVEAFAKRMESETKDFELHSRCRHIESEMLRVAGILSNGNDAEHSRLIQDFDKAVIRRVGQYNV